MMSSSDFDAVQKKASISQADERRQYAVDLLKRCDQTHDQKITPQIFINTCARVMDANNVRGSRYAEVQSVLNKLKEDRINVLEAMYECLVFTNGSSGPHSFKFTLISKLFNLTEEDAERSVQIVEDFVYAVKTLKQAARRECVNAIVSRVMAMTPEKFKAVFAQVDIARGQLNTERTAQISRVLASSELTIVGLPFYLIGKGVKKVTREITHFSIKDKIERERHSVFDATYECLSSTIGQQGPDSFKYCLIQMLSGMTVSGKNLIIPSEPECLYLRRSKYVSLETTAIIQDMVQVMNEIKSAKFAVNFNFVKECLDKCYSGEISKSQFIAALKRVRTARDETDKDEQSTYVGMFKQTLKSPKTSSRNEALDALSEKLSVNTFTVLDALNEFLTNVSGMHGPHSLKYALLKHLFPDLNKDIGVLTAVASSAMIECFIQLIPEVKAQGVKEGIPLEDVSERKSPRRDGVSG